VFIFSRDIYTTNISTLARFEEFFIYSEIMSYCRNTSQLTDHTIQQRQLSSVLYIRWTVEMSALWSY